MPLMSKHLAPVIDVQGCSKITVSTLSDVVLCLRAYTGKESRHENEKVGKKPTDYGVHFLEIASLHAPDDLAELCTSGRV